MTGADTTVGTAKRSLAELPTMITTVTNIRSLSRRMCSVTFEGGLDQFRSAGIDDFVFLIDLGTGHNVFGDGFTMARWIDLPTDMKPRAAYYSVRRFDPDTGRLEVWVVHHGRGGGIGDTWVTGVRPGARVALWGPRATLPTIDPWDHHLLVADDTGHGAVAAILDRLGDAAATVVLEYDRADGKTPIPVGHADIHWIDRAGAAPGTCPAVVDAVRALSIDPERTVAFGAGESRQMTTIRRHLRHDRKMPTTRVHVTGYWRRA